MQLQDKVAVIYGAAGATGSTVAKGFAREGAHVYVTGPRLDRVERLAAEITAAGGHARAAVVDALDEAAVEAHADRAIAEFGRIDISFNGISLPQAGIQGVGLTELSVENYVKPVEFYSRAHFITARAAARRMIPNGSGVILVNTPEVSRLGLPHVGGMAAAWAAMEALVRNLSGEFGPRGVRAVCIRTTGMPETATIDLVYDLHAKAMHITKAQFQDFLTGMTHTKRPTTLQQLQDAAIFAASDRASGMTGATINITGGMVVDW